MKKLMVFSSQECAFHTPITTHRANSCSVQSRTSKVFHSSMMNIGGRALMTSLCHRAAESDGGRRLFGLAKWLFDPAMLAPGSPADLQIRLTSSFLTCSRGRRPKIEWD